MLNFAIYISDHGYGHASRVSALAEQFISYGIFCHIVTCRPEFLFTGLDKHYFRIYPRAVDTGVKHGPNLVSDLEATKKAIVHLLANRNLGLETETAFLRENKIDLIISDAPYLVSDFATYTGIPVFAVTNFDWHYIFQGLFHADKAMIPVLNLIWALYQRVDASFCLPFSTPESIAAFPNQLNCGLLARTKKNYRDIRKQQAWPANMPILLVMFGGEGELELDYEELCKSFNGKVISTRKDVKAGNHLQVNREDDFLDLIHSADIVLCKPGYSTLAEAVQFGKYIIYCPRENYPEELALIEGLKSYPKAMKLSSLKHNAADWKKVFAKVNTEVPVPDIYNNKNREVAASIVDRFLQRKYIQSDLLSVFDLGTNNLNYLLYDTVNRVVIHKAYFTTSLGKGYEGKKISEYRLARLKSIIKPILEFDAQMPSEKIMLATGISRITENARRIKDWVTTHYPIKYELVAAKAETRFVYFAARKKGSGEEACLAIDIGGASTEFISLAKSGADSGISLNLGLMTLYNGCKDDLPAAERQIRKALSNLSYEGYFRLVGIGLTYSYLAAVYFRQIHIDPDRFDGLCLSKTGLQRILNDLVQGRVCEYTPYLADQKYLPVLKLSLLYSINLLDRFGSSEIIVCSDGISVGYANWRANKTRRNK